METVRSKKVIAVVFALVLCLSNSVLAFADSKTAYISGTSAQCSVNTTSNSISTSAYGAGVTQAKFTVTANCTVQSPSGATSVMYIDLSKNVTQGSQHVRNASFTKSEFNALLSTGYTIVKINYVSSVRFNVTVSGQVYSTVISYVSIK